MIYFQNFTDIYIINLSNGESFFSRKFHGCKGGIQGLILYIRFFLVSFDNLFKNKTVLEAVVKHLRKLSGVYVSTGCLSSRCKEI